MESHESPHDRTPDAAQAALDSLSTDRSALADHIVTPPWFYPALAAITTVIVAAPASPTPFVQLMVVAAASVALVFLVLAYQKRTGLAISRTAGPRSLGVLIVLGALVAVLFVASLALALFEGKPWVAVIAGLTYVTMLAGCRIYDRVYDTELRSGR